MIARLLAAGVGATLALAGAGKVTSWSQWRAMAQRQRLWTWVAVVIPPIELGLGAWLVAFEPSPVPLGIATCLLLVFTVFLAVSVRSGSLVPCACFGARSVRPPRWRDVARNAALILVLVVAAMLS